jgi:hypothetical protein
MLNPVLCNILPAAHAITRCDSTSSLSGLANEPFLKYLKKHQQDTELPRMTSQEMINDSVAQSIRQEIVSMLVCWQRLQETFSNSLAGH